MPMRTISRAVIPAIAALAGPVVVTGQSPEFDLTPRFAAYTRTSEIGPVTLATHPWYLDLEQIDPTGAFELEARLRWPQSHFAFRLVVLATLPADVSGTFRCSPGFACPDVLLTSDADAQVLGAALDAQYSFVDPGRTVQPFVALGGGIKHYRFSWPDATVIVTSGNHSDTAPVLRLGAGLEFRFRGQSIRAEVADWWTGEGDEIGTLPGNASQLPPRRQAQHDIAASIGWRLLSF